MDFAITTHVSLEFEVGQLQLSDRSPHFIKARFAQKSCVLLVVIVFLTLRGEQPLMLIILIEEFPTCLVVKWCVKNAASGHVLG